MLSPSLPADAFARMEAAFAAIPRRSPIDTAPPIPTALPTRVCTIRETLFCKRETLPLSEANGRVFASLHAACPPAVPIVIAGERLDADALARFAYYGKTACEVIGDDLL